MNDRYLIIVLGSYKKIEEDLNHIADSESGVNYVDGNGIFMGTFYSPYTTNDIQELLIHIPAILIFNITDPNNTAINLPSKYFKALFPEFEETLKNISADSVIKDRKNPKNRVEVEEYDNVDDILDKLSRNSYDRACLTESEKNILDNFGS